MSVIEIRHPHKLGPERARAVIDELAAGLARRFSLHGMNWTGDTLHFRGKGAEGLIAVGGDDVHVRVKLGGMLGLMRPLIESEILRELSERLA